jgi:hypothetical protein
MLLAARVIAIFAISPRASCSGSLSAPTCPIVMARVMLPAGQRSVNIRSLPEMLGEAARPLAELGGGGRRTHRANQRRTALNAAVGDVFQIVGCGAVAETRRFDGHKYHPVTALCAGEHQARQAGRQNVLAVHGADSVWRGRPRQGNVAHAAVRRTPRKLHRSMAPLMIGRCWAAAGSLARARWPAR